MLITIDKKTHTQVEIGDKEPTPELIEELRKKYRVGVMDCTKHTVYRDNFKKKK